MKLNIYITFLLITLISCNQIRFSDINRNSISSKLDSLSLEFLTDPQNIPHEYLVNKTFRISINYGIINEYKPEDIKSRFELFKDNWGNAFFEKKEFLLEETKKDEEIVYKTKISSNNWIALFYFTYKKGQWKFDEILFAYKDPTRFY